MPQAKQAEHSLALARQREGTPRFWGSHSWHGREASPAAW